MRRRRRKRSPKIRVWGWRRRGGPKIRVWGGGRRRGDPKLRFEVDGGDKEAQKLLGTWWMHKSQGNHPKSRWRCKRHITLTWGTWTWIIELNIHRKWDNGGWDNGGCIHQKVTTRGGYRCRCGGIFHSLGWIHTHTNIHIYTHRVIWRQINSFKLTSVGFGFRYTTHFAIDDFH